MSLYWSHLDNQGGGDLTPSPGEELSAYIAAGSQITLFHYDVGEMPYELNSCSYRLPCGKIGFIILSFA